MYSALGTLLFTQCLIRICDAVPDSVVVRENINTADLAQALVIPPSQYLSVTRFLNTIDRELLTFSQT